MNTVQSNENNPRDIDKALCGLCQRQFSRYTCPTCNAAYCSLTCFRSECHAECSESFYRKEIESEDGTKNRAQERMHMMELLKRLEEQDGDDIFEDGDDEDDKGQDITGLSRRLADIDIATAPSDTLLSLLNPQQREKFFGALKDPESELAQQLLASASTGVGAELEDIDAGSGDELGTDELRSVSAGVDTNASVNASNEIEVEMNGWEAWWEASSSIPIDTDSGELGLSTSTSADTHSRSLIGSNAPSGERRSRRYGSRPKLMQNVPMLPSDKSSLIYNICAVLIAYAYTTRHLVVSPLAGADERLRNYHPASNPAYHSPFPVSDYRSPSFEQSGNSNELRSTSSTEVKARQLITQLVPFITDRRSTLVYTSIEEVITGVWSRCAPGSIDAKLMSQLLRDVATILEPPRVTILEPHSSTTVIPQDYASPSTSMLAISDIAHLFEASPHSARFTPPPQPSAPTPTPVKPRSHPTVLKLAFYAAHLRALPVSFMRALATEVRVRGDVIESEAEKSVQVVEGGPQMKSQSLPLLSPVNYDVVDAILDSSAGRRQKEKPHIEELP
ncbi:hypothetical protein BJ138DRAFT_1069686 [Hygrophoropsis aurantiaca]|uniref:Uncharacterized protein n=1 Tax=Hygrophoropsis aurantiaca TaxID=72124 RepID=A0ACB8A3I5_9AGAM|nr:hypothetical protein BJ138DRAFT_1069686 [Hygrophoropsis aurantiaca]